LKLVDVKEIAGCRKDRAPYDEWDCTAVGPIPDLLSQKRDSWPRPAWVLFDVFEESGQLHFLTSSVIAETG
jgi:hypothetical protein